jgi:hypothetical protein
MEKNPLEDLPLEKLHTLLSEAASDLIKLVEEKRDGITIRNKSREIEALQSQIDKRKGNIMG